MEKNKNIDLKIGIVSSSGGHLSHMMLLKPFWEKYKRFFVTFEKEDAISQLQNEKMYGCYFPTNRNFKNLFKNFVKAFKILKNEKPDLIISSGAAISIPFFILGKIFFKCKCVYIEVFDRIDKGTISGKVCCKFADAFIVQWPEQLKVYKKGINLGSIY